MMAASNNKKEDTMNIGQIRRLFAMRYSRDDGSPAPLEWITDREETATLVNRHTGELLAHAAHDGYGKCDVTVYVSPRRAFRLVRRNEGFVVSLLPFPRVAVELLWNRTLTVARARQHVEDVLGIE
jgi:hypothetical protein